LIHYVKSFQDTQPINAYINRDHWFVFNLLFNFPAENRRVETFFTFQITESIIAQW